MDLPETVVAESLDEIITRSALRLEQEHLHVEALTHGSRQHTTAAASLRESVRVHDKLRAYRAKFN